MKDVQCYELFGGIALKNHAFSFFFLCQQILTNESMKPDRLELHFKAKHSAYVNSDVNYIESLKDKFVKRSTIKSLSTKQTASVSRTIEVSYEIYLLIAKCGKKSYYRRGFN